jgi:hypothetical protein
LPLLTFAQFHGLDASPSNADEAQALLASARATRDACEAERASAENRLRETALLLRFYHYELEHANQKLAAAEVCVGEVRARLRMRGLPVTPITPPVLAASSPVFAAPPPQTSCDSLVSTRLQYAYSFH